jgi:hypothetical protein
MKRVPAVDQVGVRLNDGVTVLDLKPGNTVTLVQLRQIIKNNGFVSKEASVRATGTVSSDQKMFTVSGTNEQLPLTTRPRETGEYWELRVAAPAKP